MANDVHINGVSFVLGQLAHLPEVHRRVINNSLTVIGQHVKREAKLNAPKSLTPTVCGDEIRHTYNRHGKGREKSKKQIEITAGDIVRIVDILNTPDKIEKGSLDNQTGLETVKISKTFSDGTNVSIFVLADSLKYKTMWKKKN